MKITRHLIITGRVQGVWYRESMRQAAEGLGVTGWVHNCHDGSVEAMIQGDPTAVEHLIAWAWQGPPNAEVAHVEIEEGDGTYSNFEKRPTAIMG